MTGTVPEAPLHHRLVEPSPQPHEVGIIPILQMRLQEVNDLLGFAPWGHGPVTSLTARLLAPALGGLAQPFPVPIPRG